MSKKRFPSCAARRVFLTAGRKLTASLRGGTLNTEIGGGTINRRGAPY